MWVIVTFWRNSNGVRAAPHEQPPIHPSTQPHSPAHARTHAAKLNSHVPHKPDNWKWFPAMQWRMKKKKKEETQLKAFFYFSFKLRTD